MWCVFVVLAKTYFKNAAKKKIFQINLLRSVVASYTYPCIYFIFILIKMKNTSRNADLMQTE